MTKLKFTECPRCGREVKFWCNRQVCVHCRLDELQAPEHKAKVKIWQAVNKAIRSGQIIRQPCERCGAGKTVAHHEDYSKPFDLVWLCRIHHSARHREINMAKTA